MCRDSRSFRDSSPVECQFVDANDNEFTKYKFPTENLRKQYLYALEEYVYYKKTGKIKSKSMEDQLKHYNGHRYPAAFMGTELEEFLCTPL